MRIKIMVAVALALAAVGLKSLDSGQSAREPINPAVLGARDDVAWPLDQSGSDFP